MKKIWIAIQRAVFGHGPGHAAASSLFRLPDCFSIQNQFSAIQPHQCGESVHWIG